MIWEHTNYRGYLKSVLADRISHNSRYSLRAMAAQLGIAQSTFCDLLKGKKNISSEMAAKLSKRLGLNEGESEYFFLLVQAESARDPAFRESILNRLRTLNPGLKNYDLSVDAFKVISTWYHTALYEYFELEADFKVDEAVRRLGITRVEAEAALERLERLELIERKGSRYRRVQGPFLAASAVPNEALRSFHRQMLQKAIECLETQSPHEKAIGTETFAFDASQLNEAKKIQEDCFKRMTALAAKSKKKTDVYHLGIHFFRITQPNELFNKET
jgi:uncharacterized protein (TIGR02147 family)